MYKIIGSAAVRPYSTVAAKPGAEVSQRDIREVRPGVDIHRSTGTSGVSGDDREPSVPPENDASVPIRLQKPEPCDWHLASFTEECTDTSETTTYYGRGSDGGFYPETDTADNRTPSGGTNHTACELSFDDRNKTLTATVRIKVRPVDIFKCDRLGNPKGGKDGKPEPIPYETSMHGRVAGNGVNNQVGEFVMKYRNEVGPTFNGAKIKKNIESVLNAHNCRLILNGCPKQAACGCRVSVKFNVELLVSINNAPVGNGRKIHKEINLFTRTQRADAGSWGEIKMKQVEKERGIWVWEDNPEDTNVEAHECGHLFNYPDEYWEDGGWVHRQYIDENFELDFRMKEVNTSKQVWQMSSALNVMGGGCNKAVSEPPSGAVHPYYLEYIRRQFCRLAGESPEYMNGDKSKPIWRRWRIGYDA